MTESVATVRLELRAKNALLHRLVTENGRTVAAFCREHGLNQVTLGNYINLSASPLRGRTPGKPAKLAIRLSEIFGILVEDLFPAALYETLSEGPITGEVSVDRYVSLSAARRLALPAAQEKQVERGELHQMLTDSMAGLRPIEQEVLRRRFGLDGDEETLAEIGSTMNRGPERVRQIEARALRKLRHPSRSRALRPFLDVRV